MQEPSPAKLVVISGELTGQVYPLETTTVTFGRDSSNSIGVPDAALSRVHCVSSFSKGRAGHLGTAIALRPLATRHHLLQPVGLRGHHVRNSRRDRCVSQFD